MKGGRDDIIYCAIVWAVRGVPKQRGCLPTVVLIRVRKPRHKTTFCKRQYSLLSRLFTAEFPLLCLFFLSRRASAATSECVATSATACYVAIMVHTLFCLYTILPLPILYVVYIAVKGGRSDIIYCAIVWAVRGGEGGAQTKGVFANNNIDSCTNASTSNNIL